MSAFREPAARNAQRTLSAIIGILVILLDWYHHLLHNKRAAMLKALLLVRGDEDVVVINVPWYLQS